METDRELMARVVEGDEAAFTGLVERFGGRLLTVARRLLGSRADAEDAVQRALLLCYTSAGTYAPAWAVSTWMYRILTNVCVDELRRRSTRAAHAAAADPDAQRAPETRRDLDLERALARVPREARVLLALRYTDGLSYEELAQVRGISINTVKSQLARGKTLLRAELTSKGVLT